METKQSIHDRNLRIGTEIITKFGGVPQRGSLILGTEPNSLHRCSASPPGIPDRVDC